MVVVEYDWYVVCLQFGVGGVYQCMILCYYFIQVVVVVYWCGLWVVWVIQVVDVVYVYVVCGQGIVEVGNMQCVWV